MAESEYPDDILANLVQAATAAADENAASSFTLGKRKRDELNGHVALTEELLNDAPDPAGQPTTPQLQNSASVLFREPSKSRKHSRPPLGSVFTSLELAPERFLRLQTAAKAFMLDEAHPERRDVVSHKKSVGGADLAKLNLWNCVEEFLSVHGHGDQYFGFGMGEGIPGAPQRTLFWPRDAQTIIKLMMPLMRKMVTNERQRIYAAATRRQTSVTKPSDDQSSTPGDESALTDPKADESPDLSTEPPDETVPQDTLAQSTETSQLTMALKQSMILHVNVVTNTGEAVRRVAPKFSLSLESVPSLSSLLAQVEKHNTHGYRGDSMIVKVWLPEGLVTVKEDGDWMVALLSASAVDWMDGEVRILVEV